MKTKIALTLLSLFALALVGCSAPDASAQPSSAPAAQAPASSSAPAAPDAVNSASPGPASGQSAAAAQLTQEQALAIALQEAGASQADVTELSIQLENQRRGPVYEIEFTYNGQEFELEVDGVTGQIWDRQQERRDRDRGPKGSQQQPALDIEQAKAIIAEKIPGLDAASLRLHLDQEEGRPVYEGSVIQGGTKYEFEIDATDGTIVSWEEEAVS